MSFRLVTNWKLLPMWRKGPSRCAKMLYKHLKLDLLVLLPPNYSMFLKLLLELLRLKMRYLTFSLPLPKLKKFCLHLLLYPRQQRLQVNQAHLGTSVKPKTDISGASKRKSAKPSKSGPVALADATPFYPTAKEKANYLHIGVNPHYIGQHEGSQFTKLVVYQCFYAHHCHERGQNPAECDVLTQNKAQMFTHIRKFHLRICIACYICPERWWSSLEWKKHMKDKHSNLPEESWYIQDTADIGADIAIILRLLQRIFKLSSS